MQKFFLILLCLGNLAIAANSNSAIDLQPLEEIEPKPFTAQSNYMSALGFARWNHYHRTGVWPEFFETEGADTDGLGDADTLSVLEALARAVKRNPLAKEYAIRWNVDRWGSEYHDQYMGQETFKRQGRKLFWVTAKAPRLDDDLLFRLLSQWDEIAKTERDYNKAYYRWITWWKAQKSVP